MKKDMIPVDAHTFVYWDIDEKKYYAEIIIGVAGELHPKRIWLTEYE